jgi:hypothetical protein
MILEISIIPPRVKGPRPVASPTPVSQAVAVAVESGALPTSEPTHLGRRAGVQLFGEKGAIRQWRQKSAQRHVG